MVVKEGYKNTEVGVIPEDWGEYYISELCSFSQGVQVDLGLQSKTQKKGTVKFLRIENYTQESADFRYIPEKYRNQNYINKKEIVVVRYGATAGFIGRGLEGVLANNLFQIKNTNKFLDLNFLYIYLKSEKTFRFFQASMSGGAMPALSFKIVRTLEIPLPPLHEQTAIATVLSDTDNLIQTLEKKIAKKELIKKGAMQELLEPKEGWEVKRLGEIGNTYGGLSGKSKSDFSNCNSKYIPFMNIMRNPIIDTEYLDSVYIKPNESQNTTLKGDLFFNGSSETPDEVGLCSVLLKNIPSLYLNSFCFGFRLYNQKEINGLYLSYYFRSNFGREKMTVLAQGATRYNLSKANFLKLEISIPSFKDQTHIAQILSDMDTEIESLQEKLSKYKQLKQGLMHELLTGRIRLV